MKMRCTFGLLNSEKTKSLLTDSLSLGEKNFEVRMLSSISLLLNLLKHILKIDHSIPEFLIIPSISISSRSLTFPIKLKFLLKFNILSLCDVMLLDLFIKLSNKGEFFIPHLLNLTQTSSLYLVYQFKSLWSQLNVRVLGKHPSDILLQIFPSIILLLVMTSNWSIIS